LASFVAREQGSVDTEVDATPCVIEGLQTFDNDLSRPPILDPHEVVEVDSRVEHRVEEFGDGAVECIERREADRLRGLLPHPGQSVTALTTPISASAGAR